MPGQHRLIFVVLWDACARVVYGLDDIKIQGASITPASPCRYLSPDCFDRTEQVEGEAAIRSLIIS